MPSTVALKTAKRDGQHNAYNRSTFLPNRITSSRTVGSTSRPPPAATHYSVITIFCLAQQKSTTETSYGDKMLLPEPRYRAL